MTYQPRLIKAIAIWVIWDVTIGGVVCSRGGHMTRLMAWHPGCSEVNISCMTLQSILLRSVHKS